MKRSCYFNVMSNPSEESKNINSWHSVDDVFHCLNSLSRISKHKSNSPNDAEKSFRNSTADVYFQHASRFESDSSLYQDKSLPNSSEDFMAYGMGRGKMIKNLEDKFGTAKLDNQIHSELRQLNPCGFSNDAIEEEFGSVSKSPTCFSEEVQCFPSPVKEEENNTIHEDLIYEQPLAVNDNQDVEKSGDPFDGENIIPTTTTTTTDVLVNECNNTKRKKRRCRNFLVLQLSSRENNGNMSNPTLKGPNEFLSQSEMPVTASNGFTYSPSDFPPI